MRLIGLDAGVEEPTELHAVSHQELDELFSKIWRAKCFTLETYVTSITAGEPVNALIT